MRMAALQWTSVGILLLLCLATVSTESDDDDSTTDEAVLDLQDMDSQEDSSVQKELLSAEKDLKKIHHEKSHHGKGHHGKGHHGKGRHESYEVNVNVIYKHLNEIIKKILAFKKRWETTYLSDVKTLNEELKRHVSEESVARSKYDKAQSDESSAKMVHESASREWRSAQARLEQKRRDSRHTRHELTIVFKKGFSDKNSEIRIVRKMQCLMSRFSKDRKHEHKYCKGVKKQEEKKAVVQSIMPTGGVPGPRVQIRSRTTDYCLSVPQAKAKSGDVVSMQECGNGAHQNWEWRNFRLISPDTNLCLNIPSKGKGGNVIISTCKTHAKDQKWKKNKESQLFSKFDHLCLGVADNSKKPGAPIITADCKGSAAQRWFFTRTDPCHFIGHMDAGKRLTQGCTLESDNGKYKLTLQKDGNAVLMEGKSPVWATNTRHKGKRPFELILLPTGGLNLLSSNEKKPLWDSKSANKGAAPYTLALQNDRNLVILDGKKKVVWDAGTVSKVAVAKK